MRLIFRKIVKFLSVVSTAAVCAAGQKFRRAGVFTEKSSQPSSRVITPAVSPEMRRPPSKQSLDTTVQKKKCWVKNFQKILVSSFCREFNMPSGFHHLTTVDICEPTCQLKLRIEVEKVLDSSDDKFFHKNRECHTA